jgi:exodeoxyribonuclease VII large subunit
VLRNAARRWPAVQFRVEQVAVQGSYAVTEVIGALRDLDADPSVEVIIVARGGGSIEDLLPFSDEELIRAVAACGTPVISAIGHEQDVPLLDLAADARASTPTDAARRAVPDVTEQLELIGQQRARARRHLAGRLDRELSWLSGIRSRPVLASPVLELDRRHEQLQALTERARRSVSMGVEHAAADIVHTRARLIALSPAATLRRGYAIVQRDDASVIRSAAEVQPGEALTVRFADDQLAVTASQDSRGEPGGH